MMVCDIPGCGHWATLTPACGHAFCKTHENAIDPCPIGPADLCREKKNAFWARLLADSKARVEQMEQARALQCREGDGCGAH